MSNKECVVLKGTVGGVNMIIDPDAEINDIMDGIREKIKSAGGFFKGNCDVFVKGRTFSKSDELRITSVMNTVFSEANIIFCVQEEEVKTDEITARNHTTMGALFIEELTKAANQSRKLLKKDKRGNIRPQKSDVKCYIGTIKKDEVLNTAGDILVVGNVEADGVIKAEGNIYIIGNLNGIAEAGIDGDEKSRIYAVGFSPQKIKIAQVTKDFDEIAQENTPKMAYLMKSGVFLEEIL